MTCSLQGWIWLGHSVALRTVCLPYQLTKFNAGISLFLLYGWDPRLLTISPPPDRDIVSLYGGACNRTVGCWRLEDIKQSEQQQHTSSSYTTPVPTTNKAPFQRILMKGVGRSAIYTCKCTCCHDWLLFWLLRYYYWVRELLYKCVLAFLVLLTFLLAAIFFPPYYRKYYCTARYINSILWNEIQLQFLFPSLHLKSFVN
jgi:hypothetical protein